MRTKLITKILDFKVNKQPKTHSNPCRRACPSPFHASATGCSALNALKALRGAPISMGRGETPVGAASGHPVLPITIYR